MTEVYRIDPGVVALADSLLAHEKRAAEELDQWKARAESKTVAFNQTTITLGLPKSIASTRRGLASRRTARPRAQSPTDRKDW